MHAFRHKSVAFLCLKSIVFPASSQRMDPAYPISPSRGNMPDRKGKRGRPPQPEAEYRKVADGIRARIKGGEWQAGTVLPSLRFLAQEYHVGVRVIRSALDLLKREDRIFVNPQRRLTAKWPEGAITTTDGLILEVTGNNLHTLLSRSSDLDLQRGIEFGAGDLWTPLLIMHDEHLRDALPDDLLKLALKGILLIGMFTPRVLKRYERLNVPVVLVDRPGQRWDLHSVAADNEQAAYDATMRLIQLGHKRIAFLRFVQMRLRDIDPDSVERQRGFTRACKESRLRWSKKWIFNSFPSDKPESPAIQAVLKARSRFTALVAVDAGRAKLVEDAARARGLTVPRDLSIACFQGASLHPLRFSGPIVDFFEMGRQATHMLSRPRRPVRHERVAATWSEGQTLAPPKRI